MEKMNCKTGALAESVCWSLEKTEAEKHMTEYVLQADRTETAAAADVLTKVIADLLDRRHVGVRVEGQLTDAVLPTLNGLFRDGRLLKRANGAAFVAMTDRLDRGKIHEGLCRLKGEQLDFRFMGFRGAADIDCAFSCLMGDDLRCAPELELICGGMQSGRLCIRADAEQVEEAEMLHIVQAAAESCGCTLRLTV